MMIKILKKKFITIIVKGNRIFKKKELIKNFYNSELEIEKYTNDSKLNHKKFIENNNVYIFNQFFIRFLLVSKLKIIFLFFLGINRKLIIPAPVQWLKIFDKNNIKVNYTLSYISFFILNLIFILNSVYLILKTLFNIFNHNAKNIHYKDYNVIVNLHSKSYLPISQNNNFNIIDYIRNEFKTDYPIIHSLKINSLTHKNIKVLSVNNFFPINFKNKINLFCKVFFLFIKSILTLKNYNFFLFKELIYYYQVKFFHSSNNLAKNYFFLLGDSIFRPIWTYYAENKGSNIIYINYASGFYGLKNIKNNNYPYQMGLGLKCMSWPKYVIDKNIYYNFLKKNYPDKNFYLSSNQINISDSDHSLPNYDPNKFTIGLFDVTPIRKFTRILYLPQDSFRETEICIQFLKDLQVLKNRHNLQILFKKKREQIYRDCKRYSNFSKKLNFTYINPDIAASRVASKCDLLINIPFTTAAFNHNRNDKVNSIFYSPFKIISNRDRASQGLNIIFGLNDLEKYILFQRDLFQKKDY